MAMQTWMAFLLAISVSFFLDPLLIRLLHWEYDLISPPPSTGSFLSLAAARTTAPPAAETAAGGPSLPPASRAGRPQHPTAAANAAAGAV